MNKRITKILTNLLLFGAFILTFFLDLTGLALHQYIGVAAGVFMIVHIITHAKWIEQVSSRFFQKISGKARFYYLVDLFLLILMVTMIVSGVFISTWVTIDFDIYPVIRDIHILSSIAGLVLLVLKLAYHWKFFANLFKRKISIRPADNQSAQPAAVPARVYSRRDALRTIGTLSAVGIFGLYKSVSAMASNFAARQSLPDPEVTTAQAGPIAQPFTPEANNTESVPQPSTSDSGGRQRRRGQGSSLNTSTNSEKTSEESAQPTQESNPITEAQPTAVPESQNCVIRCPRACAFPGECGHYIDENHNKLCDLGECLVL